jgi:hypothetical protein
MIAAELRRTLLVISLATAALCPSARASAWEFYPSATRIEFSVSNLSMALGGVALATLLNHALAVAVGGSALLILPARVFHAAARLSFRGTMSDMTALLVAVMAFAVAAAARLAVGTETHSPESEPRHSVSLSDRDSGCRSIARRGEHG